MLTKLGVYRHYRGSHYRVSIAQAVLVDGPSRGEQAMVVYTSIPEGKTYVRPYTEFHSQVYPWVDSADGVLTGTAVPRFTWVGE